MVLNNHLLHCEGEQYRFRDLRDPKLHTDRHPVTEM